MKDGWRTFLPDWQFASSLLSLLTETFSYLPWPVTINLYFLPVVLSWNTVFKTCRFTESLNHTLKDYLLIQSLFLKEFFNQLNKRCFKISQCTFPSLPEENVSPRLSHKFFLFKTPPGFISCKYINTQHSVFYHQPEWPPWERCCCSHKGADCHSDKLRLGRGRMKQRETENNADWFRK